MCTETYVQSVCKNINYKSNKNTWILVHPLYFLDFQLETYYYLNKNCILKKS